MAEGLRKSTRAVKLRKDPNFVYDSDSTQFLLANVASRGEVRQHRDRVCSEGEKSSCLRSAVSERGYSAITTNVSWLDLYKLPIATSSVSCSDLEYESSSAVLRSGSQQQNSDNSVLRSVTSLVNSSDGTEDVRSQQSSTRGDFLDSFLSVSSKVRTDSSVMSSENECVNRGETEAVCECAGDDSCTVCCPASVAPVTDFNTLLQAFEKAMGKMDDLAAEVKSLKHSTQSRLEKLESARESSDTQVSAHSDSGAKVKQPKKHKPKSVMKKEKVDFEKERQLKIMEDKLKDRNQRGDTLTEPEASSDADFNLQALKKKMSRRQKSTCSEKVSATLRRSGAVFPQEDFSTSEGACSGMDSESCARSCRDKVKSGAKISRRPVVQTELWPHTIANEEDVEDVTSDNITLAKFLSCFSYIMSNCGRTEATGRAVLLQAVSLVLECLPWTEARSFHNLIMLKIEQGRINWTTDFEILAGQFLDKRVRLSLRTRGAATGPGPSKSYRSAGRGFRSSGNNFNNFNEFNRSNTNANRSKPWYVCKQWNTGTCSYGDRCKRWHVCLSCAEAGKMGEPHKSSTHTGRGRPEEPRV